MPDVPDGDRSAPPAITRPEPGGSTVPDIDLLDQVQRRAPWGHRLFVVVITLFLAAAVLDVFGVREGEVTAASGGFQLTVTHAEVSRPGLATPWRAEVRTTDGRPLPRSLTLSTTSAYFDAFDQNGLSPQPAAESQDARVVAWTFEPPPGTDELMVTFDARLEPRLRLGGEGTTELVIDGTAVTAVDYRTRIVP